MRRVLFVALALAAGCSHHGRPTGPPPEYERPTLPPWDAGNVDPLDQVEGEAVDDYVEPAAAEPADAGAPEAAPAEDSGPGDGGPKSS